MMKKLLLSLFLSLYTMVLFGQNFVEEGNLWKMQVSGLIGTSTYFHKIEGDTIVNNQTYKKNYTSNDTMATWMLNRFVRQEGGVVYQLFNFAGATEELIYDFNLTLGDPYPAECNAGAALTEINEELLVNGESRALYVFSGPSLGTTWIEEIGSLNADVFSPASPLCISDPVYSLLCFAGNETLKYATENGDCSLLVSNNDINAIRSNLSVSPNPCSDFINIDFYDFSDLDLNIYSSQGQKVASYNNINSIISMEDFEKGIYFLRFNIGNQTVTKKVIKL